MSQFGQIVEIKMAENISVEQNDQINEAQQFQESSISVAKQNASVSHLQQTQGGEPLYEQQYWAKLNENRQNYNGEED